MNKTQFSKSYATFGFTRSLRQIKHALNSRKNTNTNLSFLLSLIQESERRIEAQLGKRMVDLRILEIGPGQGLERARYFGLKNQVTGMDLDVIPVGFALGSYARMLKQNGFSRVAKTIGRRMILGRVNEATWANVLHVTKFRNPQLIHGDICSNPPSIGEFDVIMSWSVFEHLPNPRQALENVIRLLRPGGIFYLSLHLYTSNNGHHDIRAFTGQEDQLPLWGHLRPTTKSGIRPSAYLNEWRLAEWRTLFSELAPRHTEILEVFETRECLGPHLTASLRQDLKTYTDEELFTVNAVYAWQKPVMR